MAAVRVLTFAERPDLAARTDEVPAAFPEYMGHGEVLVEHWGKLRERLPELQLVLWDEARDAVVGYGRTMPAREREGLPGGVDDMVGRWFGETVRGWNPTCSRRWSRSSTTGGAARACPASSSTGCASLPARSGFSSLIAPVRPTWKARYPLIPMDDYVGWTRTDGLRFDPWIRLHTRLGAERLDVCPASLHHRGHARGVGGLGRDAACRRTAAM